MSNSTAIVTLAIGDYYLNNWKKFCQENWQKYAKRHGYDLICIDEELDSSELAQSRSAAWQKCLVLSQDFSSAYERIVWIDADILVNPASPSIIETVPPELIGAVEEKILSSQITKRIAEIYKSRGQKSPNFCSGLGFDFYTSYGLPSGFQKIVQTGVLVLSPTHHRELLEKVYFEYEDKGGAEWSYEMRPLSYEILQNNCIHWLDARFNVGWFYYAVEHYPFLVEELLSADILAAFSDKRSSDLIIPSYSVLAKLCITTAFVNSFFLHFSGLPYADMELVDQEATSWRDCHDKRAIAATIRDSAQLCADQNQIDEAISLGHQALELYESFGDTKAKAKLLSFLGRLLAEKKEEPTLALPYLQEAFRIFQQLQACETEEVANLIDQILLWQAFQEADVQE